MVQNDTYPQVLEQPIPFDSFDTALLSRVAEIAGDSSKSPELRLQLIMQDLHASKAKHSWTGIYYLKGSYLELGPFVGESTEHTRIAVGQGLCGQAIVRDCDLDVADVSQAPGYLACSLATRSEAIVLIRYRAQVIGQIDIDSHEPGAWGEAGMRLLKAIAVIIAPVVYAALNESSKTACVCTVFPENADRVD